MCREIINRCFDYTNILTNYGGIMKLSYKLISVFFSGVVLSFAANAFPKFITTYDNFDNFTKAFCSAAQDGKEKVFMMTDDLFADQPKTFACQDGNEYKMYRTEARDDRGHFVYSIDATKKATEKLFDCDGKADMGMQVFGLNCFPVSKEVTQHRKPKI